MKSNLHIAPKPCTDRGNRILEFDFPGLQIGTAQYTEGPTGCTVFYFPNEAKFAVDVQGGSPGVVLLGQWGSGDQTLDAVCFTGGSVYGLESFAGVNTELLERRQFATDWTQLVSVHGAVIYDFRPRDNAIYPDRELGKAAIRSAQTGVFPLGRVGAGSSASVGKMGDAKYWELAGQGGAYSQVGETRVCVFTVVNAVGAITDRSGKVVRGHFDPEVGRHLSSLELSTRRHSENRGGNTTLTIVVTNQRLNSFSLRQLAKQVHCSMARAIHPFHAMTDGDVLFAVSTEQVENNLLTDVELGVVASELAWDAVLSSFD